MGRVNFILEVVSRLARVTGNKIGIVNFLFAVPVVLKFIFRYKKISRF